LTIMSSLDFEECAHKLCKIKLNSGQEVALRDFVFVCVGFLNVHIFRRLCAK
jgi:hypothetical protein